MTKEENIDTWHKIYKDRYKVMTFRNATSKDPRIHFIYDYQKYDCVKQDGEFLRFEKKRNAYKEKNILTAEWLPILAERMAERKRKELRT